MNENGKFKYEKVTGEEKWNHMKCMKIWKKKSYFSPPFYSLTCLYITSSFCIELIFNGTSEYIINENWKLFILSN